MNMLEGAAFAQASQQRALLEIGGISLMCAECSCQPYCCWPVWLQNSCFEGTRRHRRRSATSASSPLLLFFSALSILLLVVKSSVCPNDCSSHGNCQTSTSGALTLDGIAGTCSCFEGWTQPDCSAMTCPTGIAFWDAATADGIAHRSGVECSGAGTCNQRTGECICRSDSDGRKLFEGK